jgi:hypothetical protein
MIKLNLDRIKQLAKDNNTDGNEDRATSPNLLQRLKGNFHPNGSPTMEEPRMSIGSTLQPMFVGTNARSNLDQTRGNNFLVDFFGAGFKSKKSRNLLWKILGVSVLASAIPTYLHYNKYYQQEVPAARNKDLELLSRTLPIKLSQALVTGQGEEIQKTLDSAGEKHTLVITNCTETSVPCTQQKVMYATGGLIEGQELVGKGEDLSNERFDLLVSPPGVLTRKMDLQSLTEAITLQPQKIKAIGRVYYLGSAKTTPAFWDGYLDWFAKPNSFNLIYPLYALLFLAGGGAIWLVLSALERERNNILATAKSLQSRLDAERARTGQLVERTESQRQELDRYRHAISADRGPIEQEIQRYHNHNQRQQIEIEHLQNALTIEQQELSNPSYPEDRDGVGRQQIAIERLQSSIERRINSIRITENTIANLRSNISRIDNREGEVKSAISSMDRELMSLESERDHSSSLYNELVAEMNPGVGQQYNWDRLKSTIERGEQGLERNDRAEAALERHFSLFEQWEDERQRSHAEILKLEDQVEWYKTNTIHPGSPPPLTTTAPTASNVAPSPSSGVSSGRNDFATRRLAIVGGNEALRAELSQRLSQVHSITDITFIPRHQERALDLATLEAEIGDCDAIAILSKEVNPEIMGMLSELSDRYQIRGTMFQINYRSVDRIVNAIAQHFQERSSSPTSIPLSFGRSVPSPN